MRVVPLCTRPASTFASRSFPLARPDNIDLPLSPDMRKGRQVTTIRDRRRFAFKILATAGLAWLAQQISFSSVALPGYAMFAGALVAAIAATGFATRSLLGLAVVMALALIEAPTPLAWLLFSGALLSALLRARVVRFDDAWSWLGRLLVLAIGSFTAPIRDLLRWRRVRRRPDRRRLAGRLRPLLLPLGGGTVFLTLFALANPVLAQLLDALVPRWSLGATVPRAVVALAAGLLAWSVLRPARRSFDTRPRASLALGLPLASGASLLLSLLLFNLLFAVQNGLDIAYLWSGAALPPGVTLAEYAHQGAYLLIITALLAGAFVILALQPGSPAASTPAIQRLVMLWTAQNVLLVASSMLRTLDYIAVYSLTVLRLAALLWMLLVAIGLILICWRQVRGLGRAWLINANAVAALAAVLLGHVVDLGEVAASWNVRHARELGGRGAPLDLCYLDHLGAAALRPLTGLALGLPPGPFTDQVLRVRARVLSRSREGQRGASWSWRDQRRLRDSAVLLPAPSPIPAGAWQDCDGRIVQATPVTVTRDRGSPLTSGAVR